MQSTLTRVNMLGGGVTSGATIYPTRRLSSLSGLPQRVLVRRNGFGSVLVGMSPSALTDGSDTFEFTGSFDLSFVFVVEPGAALYARSADGLAAQVSVAVSGAVPIADVAAMSRNGGSGASRVARVPVPSQHVPVPVYAAPSASPAYVTVTARSSGLRLAYDPVQLSSDPDACFLLPANERDQLIMAPGSTLYATTIGSGASAHISTSCFTDVIAAMAPASPTEQAVRRVLWSSLWTSDGDGCW